MTTKTIRTLLAWVAALGLLAAGCKDKPPAPTPDAGKKYGGQFIDEAKAAADIVKAGEHTVDDGVDASGGNTQ